MADIRRWFSSLTKTSQIIAAIVGLLVFGGSCVTFARGIKSVPDNMTAMRDSIHVFHVRVDSLSNSALDILKDIERMQADQVCLQVATAKHQDIDQCLVEATRRP